MDFLTTANMLMMMREHVGHAFHYRFDECGLLQIEIVVDENVPEMFEQATQMFAPR